jgi:transcriptional antiterminator NusG
MAQTGKKWYVLRAVSGKEGKVKEYLEALMKKDDLLAANVGEILLPTEKYAQLRNGKRVVKEKLFLPGYVLVEANLQGEVAHTLRFMPNVLGFLGGLDNPTPVRQADINRILGTAEDITIKSEEVAIPFTVDEAVKVTDGPFSGFSGIIEEVNAEKRKLKVMVKIFGRKTPLELSYNQVEKE